MSTTRRSRRLNRALPLLLVGLVLAACEPTGPPPPPDPEPAKADLARVPDVRLVYPENVTVYTPQRGKYGYTLDEVESKSVALVEVSSHDPGTILRETTITGLPAGAGIYSLDFHPVTGALYGRVAWYLNGIAHRDNHRDGLYRIDLRTGRATRVGAWDGLSSIEFDPATNRLRSAPAARGHHTLDLGGLAFPARPIEYAADESSAGTTIGFGDLAHAPRAPRDLFVIDSTADVLLRVDPADSGVARTVGALNANVHSNDIGFDFAADGTGFVLARYNRHSGEAPHVFTIDTAAGALRHVGAVPDRETELRKTYIPGMAVVPGGVLSWTEPGYRAGEAQGYVDVEIKRTGGDHGAVTAAYNGPAGSGTVRFADGQKTALVRLPIRDDLEDEPDEVVALTLSNPTGGATLHDEGRTARLVIVDDDEPNQMPAPVPYHPTPTPTPTPTPSGGTIQLDASSVSPMQNESVDNLQLVLVRDGDTSATAIVQYSAAAGTATAGSDYTLVDGTATFGAGHTHTVINVAVGDDALAECHETFSVTLAHPSGGTLGARTKSQVLIEDDDQAGKYAQCTTATAPSARWEAAMAFDAERGRTVLFGGVDGSHHRSGETWLWDGGQWVQQSGLATAPSARAHASMAYDPVAKRVVLFGGVDADGPSAETWLWDGVAWSKQTPATSPPAMADAVMAYRPGTGVVLVGHDGKTWAWDGTTWADLGIAAPAANLSNAAMALDPDGDLVLFGGTTGGGPLAGTWLFDGTAWAAGPAGPSARTDAVMAYYADPFDASSRRTVLIAGAATGDAELDETWIWDGSAWAQETPATKPAARQRAVLAPQRGGGLLLFGGVDAANAALGDTWSYRPPA